MVTRRKFSELFAQERDSVKKHVNASRVPEIESDLTEGDTMSESTPVGASINAQAIRLGDTRFHSIQRHLLASQIERLQGNQHLQRILDSLKQAHSRQEIGDAQVRSDSADSSLTLNPAPQDSSVGRDSSLAAGVHIPRRIGALPQRVDDIQDATAMQDKPSPAQASTRLQPIVGNASVARATHIQLQPTPAPSPEAQEVASIIPSPEVPDLSVATITEATQLLQQGRRQAALDLILNDLVDAGRIDWKLLQGGRFVYSTAVTGEGDTLPPGYRQDPATGTRRARPTRLRIGARAFGHGFPWLYSTIMHEYQHVLQFQTDGGSVVPGQGPMRYLILQQDTEAYAWEILNARNTGMAANERQIRESWLRLHDNWSRLGTPGRRSLADLYRRAYMEASAILGTPPRGYTPL